MKIFCLIMTVIILLTGCTSVPRVSKAAIMEDGRYCVEINRDYLSNEKEFEYAVNSFVKDLGHESYDIENHERRYNFLVTTPGSTLVEDLPVVKHFHRGRTMTAIFVPAGIITGLSVFVLMFFIGEPPEGAI